MEPDGTISNGYGFAWDIDTDFDYFVVAGGYQVQVSFEEALAVASAPQQERPKQPKEESVEIVQTSVKRLISFED